MCQWMECVLIIFSCLLWHMSHQQLNPVVRRLVDGTNVYTNNIRWCQFNTSDSCLWTLWTYPQTIRTYFDFNFQLFLFFFVHFIFIDTILMGHFFLWCKIGTMHFKVFCSNCARRFFYLCDFRSLFSTVATVVVVVVGVYMWHSMMLICWVNALNFVFFFFFVLVADCSHH